MTKMELYNNLEAAQTLLSEVYHFAGENGMVELEKLMSMADTMINDAYEELKEL